MHFNVLNRKVHYWASFIIAIPLGVIIGTGVLLQMKKQWTWVQPAEQRGTGKVPTLTLDEILARVKTVPGMNVQGWEDVNRLDVRPSRGMVKVWLMNNWEVQVDLTTGAILQTAYRRSDWIESIHDGSVFAGDWTKLGLFLPTGVTLFGLWLTGLWMCGFRFPASAVSDAGVRKRPLWLSTARRSCGPVPPAPTSIAFSKKGNSHHAA